jgi:hypothetical protein
MTTTQISESVFKNDEAVVDPLLVTILKTRRADGSIGDTNFRLWLKKWIEEQTGHSVTVAERGNIIVTTDSKSQTLFSCHVDTCHTLQESDGKGQNLAFDADMGYIYLDKPNDSSCLGADDGVGIWLMLNMIIENVPGTYIFHTGEERGGQGAHACLKGRADWLKQFKRAIAFDRPKDYEVIISQGGMQCASNEAGEWLAKELSKHNLTYKISHKGVFTDTKVYAGIIPECFNIGVGYYNQHTSQEQLDYNHASALMSACLLLDWDAIPTVRKPNTYKPVETAKPNTPKQSVYPSSKLPTIKIPSLLEEVAEYSLDDLEDICIHTPAEGAKLIARLHASYVGKCAELDAFYDHMGVQ